MKIYLLKVWNAVEIELLGPYKTCEARFKAAKRVHKEIGENDSLFWMDIGSKKEVAVGCYRNGDFE